VLTCQLYLLTRRQRSFLDRIRPSRIGMTGIIVGAALFAQFYYFGTTDRWYAVEHFTYGAFVVNLHLNFLFAPCCYLVIFSLACGGWRPARLLGSRPARFFGDISYSSYLSHEFYIDKLYRLGLLSWGIASYLIVLLAAVYATSWVLYSLVEVPAKRSLRSVSKIWLSPARVPTSSGR
jgi:peptidoglycan/LPS O-acetylase OafA/YrhL